MSRTFAGPAMSLNVPLILRAVLDEYTLPWDGPHGVAHWARVLENGLRLAEETGADAEVVTLFALLHDSRRISEGSNPDHGPRAAAFAETLRSRMFDLPDHWLGQLCIACSGHTHEQTNPDVTVQTCWDADRLDLLRVGITPQPSKLCTEAARRPEMLRWANGRAAFWVVPEFVRSEWGIELSGDL